MKIKNVTVFGSGVLGAQIAFQTAYHGYNVTLYDINYELLEKAKVKFGQFRALYQQDLNAAPVDLDAAESRISVTTDLAASVTDADLTIEAIPENIQLKNGPKTKMEKIFAPNMVRKNIGEWLVKLKEQAENQSKN